MGFGKRGNGVYDYKKLKVWERAVDLYVEVREITMGFPNYEKYSLGDQMRRSAESISSNLVEGSGKGTNKSYIAYIHNSIGSKKELENQLVLACKAGYISEEKKDALLKELDEIGKMLFGVIKFLKKEMDIGKYWDMGVLEEFGNFESVVGTNYAGRFIRGIVYAKLNKKGDVLVSPERRVKILNEIFVGGIYGVAGVVSGGILCSVAERLATGLPVELSSPIVIAGEIAGGAGGVALIYYALKGKILFGTTNPLSTGADDLEKRVGVIKKALDCQSE